MTIEANGGSGEVRDVVRAELVLVVLQWILLRQKERCAAGAFFIDVAEVETGVQTIVASAGEDEPATAAAPVVKAFGIFAVHRFSS